MTEIKWQEPGPDPRGGGSPIDAVAAQLREHPGRWALVEESVIGNAGDKWKKRGLEITRRGTGELKKNSRLYDIYARFVEEGGR